MPDRGRPIELDPDRSGLDLPSSRASHCFLLWGGGTMPPFSNRGFAPRAVSRPGGGRRGGGGADGGERGDGSTPHCGGVGGSAPEAEAGATGEVEGSSNRASGVVLGSVRTPLVVAVRGGSRCSIPLGAGSGPESCDRGFPRWKNAIPRSHFPRKLLRRGALRRAAGCGRILHEPAPGSTSSRPGVSPPETARPYGGTDTGPRRYALRREQKSTARIPPPQCHRKTHDVGTRPTYNPGAH